MRMNRKVATGKRQTCKYLEHILCSLHQQRHPAEEYPVLQTACNKKRKEQHLVHRANRENHRPLNRWLKKRSVKWTEIQSEREREKEVERTRTEVYISL